MRPEERKSMHHFLPAILYVCFIGFLPLIYVTLKTLSFEKLKNRTFTKLLVKDFIRTIPVCALVCLPFFIEPKITKPYLMIIQAIFMPLMFLELGHIYLFGVRIGLNTFYSFFVTNIRETKEFISQNIPPILYIGIVLGSSFLFTYPDSHSFLFFFIHPNNCCDWSNLVGNSIYSQPSPKMAQI